MLCNHLQNRYGWLFEIYSLHGARLEADSREREDTSVFDVEANKGSGELFCCPQWRIQLVRSLILSLLNAVLLVGAIVSLLASTDKEVSCG